MIFFFALIYVKAQSDINIYVFVGKSKKGRFQGEKGRDGR